MPKQQYPSDFVNFLELRWGAGFLSPGGSDEVLEILKNIDVQGKALLDIGCGTGGPAMVIARELNPARVIAIDIEEELTQQASQNVRDAGLEGTVEIRHVNAGALDFDAKTFDIIFTKDSLIHVTDKPALYEEVLRVLKPGGVFAASDWLKSEDAEQLQGYNDWQAASSLTFTMQTAEQAEKELSLAGFSDIQTRDRNEWYARTAAAELEMMQSAEWQEKFIAAFGVEELQKKMPATETNTKAALCGGLRPTHLFGTKTI